MSFPPLSPTGFTDVTEPSPLQYAQEPDDVYDFDDGETLASSWVDAGEIRQREETPQPGAFRFKGRYCVLTYSQVPPTFNPGDIGELLRRDRASFIVCREPHRDGGTHYHVFVDYKRVRDLNGARRWDVQGVHPNLLRVRRTPWRAYAYVTKHEDVLVTLDSQSLLEVRGTIPIIFLSKFRGRYVEGYVIGFVVEARYRKPLKDAPVEMIRQLDVRVQIPLRIAEVASEQIYVQVWT